MSKGLRAVLFDKDGTLIDFQATWAPTFHTLIEQVAEGDHQVMERLAKVSGYRLADRRFEPDSVLVAGTNCDVADAWGAVLGIDDVEPMFQEIDARIGTMSLPHLTPFDDLVPVLDALAARNLALGVATNDSEASARVQLAALGLDDRFAAVIGADSGHGAKPDPGMVTGFCARLDLDPQSVVMVGDSLHDMHAGRAAGARTVAVTTGTVSAAVLSDHADHVAGSLTEALFWIEAAIAV